MYKVRFKVQTISSKQLCVFFQIKTQSWNKTFSCQEHVVPRMLKAAGRELVTGDNRNKHRNVATTFASFRSAALLVRYLQFSLLLQIVACYEFRLVPIFTSQQECLRMILIGLVVNWHNLNLRLEYNSRILFELSHMSSIFIWTVADVLYNSPQKMRILSQLVMNYIR